MYLVSAGLAALAFTLAWPIPVVLASARWPARSPALALALWQGIALGGGLAMLGALLSFGLAPFQDNLWLAISDLAPRFFSGPLTTPAGVIQICALSTAVLLFALLLLNLVNTAVQAERERRRQQGLIRLLSDPLPGESATRVIAHPTPAAYCLPGIHSATVLTEGLLNRLSPTQLQAVLAHERAHLNQYHHLILLAFQAWNAALPWFPIANRSVRAVQTLTEMLADNAATVVTDRRTVAEAMALTSESALVQNTGIALNEAAEERIQNSRITRLLDPPAPLGMVTTVLTIVATFALVTLPAASLFLLVVPR